MTLTSHHVVPLSTLTDSQTGLDPHSMDTQFTCDDLCDAIREETGLQKITLIVESGMDVNQKESIGQTPLHCAAWNNRHDVVDYLIHKAGAKPTCDDVCVAIKNRSDLRDIKLLVESCGDVSDMTWDGLTPLCCAVVNKCQDLVDYLIEEAGAKPTLKYLSWAIEHGSDLQTIKAIVASCFTEYKNAERDFKPALKCALEMKRLDVFDFLVSETGVTPGLEDLCSAIYKPSDLDLIKLWVEVLGAAGIDHKDRDWGDWGGYLSPLHSAVYSCVDVIDYLIEDVGVSVDVRDHHGRTALSSAADLGNAEICERLVVKHHADVSLKGGIMDHDATACARALWESNVDILDMLMLTQSNSRAKGTLYS